MDFRCEPAASSRYCIASGMSGRNTQDEEILLPKCYTPLPPRTKLLPSTAQLINVGLVKTHGRCLPIDLQFAPYQVDNVVFHFPLPPSSKPTREQPSPIDSAVCIPDLLAETAKTVQSQIEATTPVEHDARYKKRLRRETIVDLTRKDALVRPLSPQTSEVTLPCCEAPSPAKGKQDDKVEKQLRRKTKIDLPKREVPVHPLVPQTSDILPPSYKDAVAQDQKRVELERQQALNKLEDKPTNNDDLQLKDISNDTKRQLADMSCNQKPQPLRIGTAPSRRSASRPPTRKEEINPDFQSSSDALRRRAASIQRQRQEEPPPPVPPKSRSRSYSNTNKAQMLLGLRDAPEKSTIEQLFDQAILEFQQQTPEIAEKISQRKDVGFASAWRQRNQRREILDEQAFYTPGSAWRPAARVHRSSEGSREVKIGTAALANRLGLPMGYGAQLQVERKGR